MLTTSSVRPEKIEPASVGAAEARLSRHSGLLCVANFPPSTGYAWHFIEGLYRSLADHFASLNVSTWVAYPSLKEPPPALRDGAARAAELDIRFGSWRSIRRLFAFVRRENIKVIYLTDRPVWHPAYAALRLAGVRWIVVHDHTSGSRRGPTGLRRLLKRHRHRFPGSLADRVLAVSDYVAKRKVEVDLVPAERVRRIWNSRPWVEPDAAAGDRLRALVGVGTGLIVACACRATPEKGVAHLLRAFDRYCASLAPDATRPTLVYFGDGPMLPALNDLHGRLRYASNIVLAGYRADAPELLAGADVCVVPSIWQEAFGLAALEPMTYGIPVIASRVGGIPEVVIDGETGLLTEPGDEGALEGALRLLLSQPAERERLGRNGLRRARTEFSREKAIRELIRMVEPGFACDPGSA